MGALPRWFMGALALVLLAAGTWFYVAQEQQIRLTVERELGAIARLKVSQIATWRKERLGDAGVLMDSPFLAEGVARWLADPRPEQTATIRAKLRSLHQHYPYDDVLLEDVDGNVRLRLGGRAGADADAGVAQAVAKALREERPLFVDLQEIGDDAAPSLSVIAPLFVGEGEARRPIGAIVLVSDARRFLFPLVETWPALSLTAETLLVRREGEDVLFLNELRHRHGTALKLRVPLSQTEMPAVQAVLGKEGIVEGKDYRGVEVLAAVQPIPRSPWFLVAKIDEAEAFAGWRSRSVLSLVLLLGWVGLVGAALLVVWQRNEKRHYRALYQAEAGRRESDAHLRSVFAALSEGIVLVHPEGTVIAANPAAARILGLGSAGELLGQDVGRSMEVLREDGTPCPREEWPISLALTSGAPCRGVVLRIPRADGSLVWIEVNCEPILDSRDAASPVAAVASFRDVDERKRAEAERETLQSQLLQAQKMETVGRLAGGVAHDFNNMLMVILGHAELALTRIGPSDPVRADVEEIQQAAQRSADLTRQLLALARRQTVAPKVLDLNVIVEGMLKMLQRLIGEDIDLAWRPAADLWPVEMDPSQIDQVLANLAVNARDAIGGVGKLTIETANATFDAAYCADHADFLPGAYVRLAVSDDGSGMAKEVLDHLFEPFFTTKEMGQGTGLGLATVYGIVRQNDGFIDVYSEPGKGSSFKIYLPRCESAGVPAEVRRPDAAPVGYGETVLVVEDEPTLLDVASVMLARLGYRVLTADTPAEAIRQAETHPGEIDLLITDVVMPGVNGRDLAERLDAIEPGLRRLFMSGYTTDVIAHRGVLEAGVLFLQKPFSMQDLAAKVREAIERPADRGAAPF